MDDVTPFARLLRILWSAITTGGALILVVFGGLVASETAEPTLAENAQGVFALVALLSIGALAMALFLIRTMEGRLTQASSRAEARQITQSLGIASLGIVDASAIGAAVAAFLTGDVLLLAFGVPLFAFAALTWPSDARVEHWLSLHEGQR